MNKSFKYLPPNKRKKLVMICDDIRVHSGVATVAKEIITHTCGHFNWVNIGGAINHPDKDKVLDISAESGKTIEINDASVKIYCVNGYGNDDQIRQVMDIEKPDAIVLFTDPRYFAHVFNMEDSIRKVCPIAYINIWDDYPAPRYNQAFYESCDLLMGISKQTKNINELVLADCDNSKRVFKYIPHGLNHNDYYPVTREHDDYKDMMVFRNDIFKGDEVDYSLFFNSRNIRRKQIPDTMMAFRNFLDGLPIEKAKKCRLILHTELVTDHGTDLNVVKELLFDEKYPECIVFSTAKVDRKHLNYLYNIADAQILLTSNEGWGLTLTESMLAGTPIIANTTGGMQDQMRFVDENGKWFEPSPEVPSNHRGTYKEHGEWAFPVYPTSRSIQGSPPTPYIYDDRCAWEDATERIKEIYALTREERKARGLKGREWALSDEAGFTAEKQAERVVEAFTELFKVWEPREDFEIVNATEHKGKMLNHKIIY
jgi:glycosyltransferase involved in cell wall biosynthesis|tara:strand:+ start:2437 stop:3888 length:1452 start_codon:yes stop_codon:yes gene_type:complete